MSQKLKNFIANGVVTLNPANYKGILQQTKYTTKIYKATCAVIKKKQIKSQYNKGRC
jgi:hypothetical protein